MNEFVDVVTVFMERYRSLAVGCLHPSQSIAQFAATEAFETVRYTRHLLPKGMSIKHMELCAH